MTTTTILNGVPANMIVDTGAMETVLTDVAAKRLALKLEPTGYFSGVGGTSGSYRFVARSFQIGGLHGRNLNLMASEMTLSSGPVQIDGLLGANFLAAYDIDLDMPEHQAILFKAFGDCNAPAAYLQGPLYGIGMVQPSNPNDHRAMVQVEIDGKTLTAVVDSGAAFTTIFRNAARRLGLNLADLKTDNHFHVSGVGPNAPEAVRHVMTPITVGELKILNMPVAIVDQHSFDSTDMLLGMDFLRRVHVWYGFSSRTLVMQYPPRPSPAVPN